MGVCKTREDCGHGWGKKDMVRPFDKGMESKDFWLDDGLLVMIRLKYYMTLGTYLLVFTIDKKSQGKR